MKITVKTTLVEITADDEPTLHNGYIKRDVLQLELLIEKIIIEAIKLHGEVSKFDNSK